MSDNHNYRNITEIKLADLANELGDYELAIQFYSKVLNRLKINPDNRIVPVMNENDLVQRIEKLNKSEFRGKSILKSDTWTLTKSSFVKGKQCLKYLYLDKHKKHEKTPISKEKQELFNQGRTFEELVRNNEFPDGINIKDQVAIFEYFNSYTSHVLSTPISKTIYEATIIEDDVLVMCDILFKDENGMIDIYEIKLNTEINDAILNDLSIQYAICKKRFNSKLNSFNLILRTDQNGKNWKVENLTASLEKLTNDVYFKISDYKDVLTKEEPILKMGEHCKKPYECEFIEYCKKQH